MGRTTTIWTVGVLFGLASPAVAAPGAGTFDDPVVVDAFPYVIADTTEASPSDEVDFYSCSPNTDETGPERVFAFSLAQAARVTAWVEGDGGSVDVDVHLLSTADLAGGVATDCVARGNVIAEAEMSGGDHFVVVDSYDGEAQAGPFVLHLEAIGDFWIERTMAEGVTWRARRFEDLYGSQVVHELTVDTQQPDVEIRAIASSGCQTVGALGAAAGAVAGINGGYFGSGCAPVSLLKESGSLLGTNGVSRGAFGLTTDMTPMVEVVAAGQDWPAAHEAHGGGPTLVVGGVASSGSAAWAAEGFSSSGFIGNNPRTFAGFDDQGISHLGTVDGRRSNAAGMSLDELAAFVASAEVGLSEGVNLDGGGSTTLWIDGATPNGVVNYPSDDPNQEVATHPGSRPNSGGLFVFAPEFNHPPRFQTEPVTDAAADSPYSYDADAIDLDPADVVSYALLEGPAGMTIDGVTGEVSFAPTTASPPSATVTIEAGDDRGAASEQTYTLTIEGGLGGGGGAGGAGGADGGGGGQGGAPTGGLAGEDDGSCGCRVAGVTTRSHGALLLGVTLLGLARRGSRRRREP
ncbi:MAG: phosphodiester glycosidase family protein [Deltaproteobacteria bacterium]|nr:phosphodiester glycosidase family protein [Deltaproteobacteria bacterium]